MLKERSELEAGGAELNFLSIATWCAYNLVRFVLHSRIYYFTNYISEYRPLIQFI